MAKQKAHEPWDVAELLDEIARNASPVAVMRKAISRLRQNANDRNSLQWHASVGGGKLLVMYVFPFRIVMKGMKFTPEEVLNWLKTSEEPDLEFGIQNKSFTITRIYRDPDVIRRYREVRKGFGGAIQESNAAKQAKLKPRDG